MIVAHTHLKELSWKLPLVQRDKREARAAQACREAARLKKQAGASGRDGSHEDPVGAEENNNKRVLQAKSRVVVVARSAAPQAELSGGRLRESREQRLLKQEEPAGSGVALGDDARSAAGAALTNKSSASEEAQSGSSKGEGGAAAGEPEAAERQARAALAKTARESAGKSGAACSGSGGEARRYLCSLSQGPRALQACGRQLASRGAKRRH